MLGFTLMGRSFVHRDSQNFLHQILNMIAGYVFKLYMAHDYRCLVN